MDSEAIPGPARRGGWWRWPATALAVAVVSVGAVAADGRWWRPQAPPNRSGVLVDAASLLVREGSLAQGTGHIVALPGQPVRFCAPMVFYGGPDPDGPIVGGCRGVDVVGVNLARLSQRRELDGAVEGYAHLWGVYRSGVLTVAGQSEPHSEWQPNSRHVPSDPPPPPCPPPPGGWYLGEEGNSGPLGNYVHQHPTVFGPSRTAYAAEIPDGSTPALGVVLVVSVANGDLAEVEQTLRNLYPHNLCVIRAPYSNAELTEVKQQLEPLSTDSRFGFWSYGPGFLDLVVLDQYVYDRLQHIDTDKLVISSLIYPVTK